MDDTPRRESQQAGASNVWRRLSEHATLRVGGCMFNDLFHLVDLLEHDYREEHGDRVHSYTCRRCEIALRLRSFREKIRRLLRDVDFDVGDPVEKTKDSDK